MLKWVRHWHWLQNVCPAEKPSWWSRMFVQADVAWENQGRLASGGDAVSRITSLYVVKTHMFRDQAVVEGEWFVGPWGWLKNRARPASQAQGPLLPESRKKAREEFSQRKDTWHHECGNSRDQSRTETISNGNIGPWSLEALGRKGHTVGFIRAGRKTLADP